MVKLLITYKDYIHCTVHGLLSADLSACVKEFKVFIPSARFQASYKLGRWDGYKQYFTVTGQTYVNLLPRIFEIIDLSKYEIEYVYPDDIIKDPDLGDDVDSNYFSYLNWYDGHYKEGEPIILEEHQVRVINTCLKNHRCIIDAATGSGKTLISAVLAKKVLPFGKTILIVPSKDLAFQSANEFKQWGLDAGIVGCGIRDFGHDVTVCTWQTINSMERSKKEKPLTMEELQQLKDGVISLIFDECHQCKSYHIQQVCDSTFKNVPIKWGLTGTVPKEKSDYYCLYTSLGGVGAVVEAKELQDKGFLANCNINCVRLEDNTLSPDFTTEIKYLESNDERTTFIAQLLHSIVQSSGNTLVLLSHINYGEKLTEKLINLGTNAIFLNGEVKSTKRFEEYEKIKTENNKCIVAIDKIASTGLSISRLFNLVFIDYGKAFTKTIQSVGRGLRLAKDKDFVEIYDISSTIKYSKKHFNERIHYYDEKKYPFRILNIDKWK